MSKLAYHVDHYKSGATGSIGRHNWEKRGKQDKHSNQEIDPEKSHLNMKLLVPESSLYMAAKNRIEKACTGRVTSASNWLTETLVYPPDDLIEKNDSKEIERYFKDVLEWHRKEFGEENVVASVVHMDETTPHLHTDIVPITKDGRLSSKELFARKELYRHHTELATYLQKKGWNVQRGESTKDKQVRSKTVPEYKKAAEVAKREALQNLAETSETLETIRGKVAAAQQKLELLETPEAVRKVEPKTTFGGVKLRQEEWELMKAYAEQAAAAVEYGDVVSDMLEDVKEQRDQLQLEVEELRQNNAEGIENRVRAIEQEKELNLFRELEKRFKDEFKHMRAILKMEWQQQKEKDRLR